MASQYEWRYVGPNLADLYPEEPLKKTMRRMASTGGDRMHAAIADLTPIDTGNLATSWDRGETTEEPHGGSPAYVSRVSTSVDYAPFVEYGTGLWGPEHRKYLIEPHPPNEFLSWIDPRTGRRTFARRVWHPGSPGRHMVAMGTALVESLLDEILKDDLERMALEYDTVADAAQVR